MFAAIARTTAVARHFAPQLKSPVIREYMIESKLIKIRPLAPYDRYKYNKLIFRPTYPL